MDPTLNSRLLQAKSQLNDVYDALNQAWQEAESLIVSMNLGEEVAVFMWTDEPNGAEQYPDELRPDWNNTNSIESEMWDRYLAFSFRLQKWQLLYVMVPHQYDWDNPWQGRWVPIRECSLEKRLEAAEYLEPLLTKVAEEAEKKVVEIEQVAAKLKAVTAPLKEKKGGKK